MNEERRTDVVLQASGVKAIALSGAWSGLATAGYRLQRVAGVSAGALVASLLAAGASAERLRDTMLGLEYPKLADRRGWGRVPIVGNALALLLDDGVHAGDFLREWLGNELSDLGVETFADLAIDDPDDGLRPDQRYRLMVTATDVTNGRLLRLPWDYRDCFGLEPDKQLVVDAVRAAMATPLYFEPAYLTDSRTGAKATLVDGSVLGSFPIDCFDRTDDGSPRWPTLGVIAPGGAEVRLLSLFGVPDSLLGLPHPRLVTYLESLVSTSMAGHSELLSRPWVSARSMTVEAPQLSAVHFGLDDAQRQGLFDAGRLSAESFLTAWSFDRYVARYRRERPEPGEAADRLAQAAQRLAISLPSRLN